MPGTEVHSVGGYKAAFPLGYFKRAMSDPPKEMHPGDRVKIRAGRGLAVWELVEVREDVEIWRMIPKW